MSVKVNPMVLKIFLFIFLILPIRKLFSQEIENISIISRWPYGPCEALFSVDSIIFAGNGSALQILKLYNNEFEKISEIDLRSFISDIYVNGNNVIAGTNNGITVVDITTLTQPIIKKNFFTYNFTQSVIKINDDIFYSDYYEMNVIKNFESDNHKIYKIHSVQGYSHFYIEDSIAYVTDTRDGVYIYDISDLNRIKQIQFYDMPNFYNIPQYFTPDKIYKYKDKFLICASTNYYYYDIGLIYLFGVNDDKTLFEISHAEVRGDWSSSARELVWKDSLVYCTYISDASTGLSIYKLTDSVFYEINDYNIEIPQRIKMFNETTLLISNPSGINLFNIADIKNVKKETVYNSGSATNSVLLNENKLYAASGNGINLFSVSQNNIEEINAVNTNSNVTCLYKNGEYLYAGGLPSYSYSFNIFDVSTLNPMTSLDGSSAWSSTKSFRPKDNLLFTVDSRNGFKVFDIINPISPNELYKYSYNERGWDIALKDSICFFAKQKEILIIDFSDLSNIRIIDSIQTESYPFGLALKDNYLFVAERDIGLTIWDVSNLSSIHKTSNLSLEGFFRNIRLERDYIYLIDYSSGLIVVDISNPESPYKVGYYKTVDISNVSVYNNMILIAEGKSGFTILKNKFVENRDTTSTPIPSEFLLRQNYPNPFNPNTIINYSIAKREFVEIKIYNSLGQEIKSLINEINQPGNYSVNFNGSNLSSGVYFYRIKAGSFSQTKKMILLK